MASLYLFGPPWDLRGSLLIGKFRGNQILTPGLTMSNAKCSVIVVVCISAQTIPGYSITGLLSDHTLTLDVK